MLIATLNGSIKRTDDCDCSFVNPQLTSLTFYKISMRHWATLLQCVTCFFTTIKFALSRSCAPACNQGCLLVLKKRKVFWGWALQTGWGNWKLLRDWQHIVGLFSREFYQSSHFSKLFTQNISYSSMVMTYIHKAASRVTTGIWEHETQGSVWTSRTCTANMKRDCRTVSQICGSIEFLGGAWKKHRKWGKGRKEGRREGQEGQREEQTNLSPPHW